MAIFRVNKNKDYAVMSKYHLKEKEMSLKAKGLLSQMLSLPNEWDYSISGLVAINKENESAIKSTLSELKDFGYLKITKLLPNITTSGRIEYIYDIYEKPIQEGEKQEVENQPVEFQPVENHTQLNNKELSNKELNNNNKHIYGEYKHVKLTDSEFEKLKKEYSNYEELITYLDEYIEMKGYKAKNHYLCIKKWVVSAVNEHSTKDIKKHRWLDKEIKNDEEEFYISDEDRRRFGI